MKFKNKKQKITKDMYGYVLESARRLSKYGKCQVVVLEKGEDLIYTPIIYDAHRFIDKDWCVVCIFQDGNEV